MNYRNAKFCSDGICINCEIEHPKYGWIPFTCNPVDQDCEFDTSALHQRMIDDGNVACMTQQEIDDEASGWARLKRDIIMVNELDPIVSNPLRWASLSAEQQQAVASYRQALLDITQQPGFPHDITWPELSL